MLKFKKMSELDRTVAWAKEMLRHDSYTVWNGKPPFRFIEINQRVCLPKYV